MTLQANIFIKQEVINDSTKRTSSSPEIFKGHINGLLRNGYIIAIGEEDDHQIFDDVNEFEKWYDRILRASDRLSKK